MALMADHVFILCLSFHFVGQEFIPHQKKIKNPVMLLPKAGGRRYLITAIIILQHFSDISTPQKAHNSTLCIKKHSEILKNYN